MRMLHIVGVTLVFASASHAKITNFDADPDLDQALYYDLERNGGLHKQADRALAESHYLAYLQRRDDLDTAQKSRVYSQLGVLWTTAINLEKGEKPDFKKAKAYFEKALKAEPQRVGYETLRARSLLPAVSHTGGMERLMARVAFYDYLRSLDEPYIRKHILPIPETKVESANVPQREQLRAAILEGRESPADREVKRLLQLVDQLKYSHIYNAATCDAPSLEDPQEGWHYILNHLPSDDTEMIEIVHDAMQSRVDPIITETLNLFINDTFMAPEVPSGEEGVI